MIPAPTWEVFGCVQRLGKTDRSGKWRVAQVATMGATLQLRLPASLDPPDWRALARMRGGWTMARGRAVMVCTSIEWRTVGEPLGQSDSSGKGR